jgi:hypothetical protein
MTLQRLALSSSPSFLKTAVEQASETSHRALDLDGYFGTTYGDQRGSDRWDMWHGTEENGLQYFGWKTQR